MFCMPVPRTPRLDNARVAKRIWPSLSWIALQKLQALTQDLSLSVSAGDLIYLDRGWYVTHTGLLRLASNSHCVGIDVRPVLKFCDPNAGRWAFKATVFKSAR